VLRYFVCENLYGYTRMYLCVSVHVYTYYILMPMCMYVNLYLYMYKSRALMVHGEYGQKKENMEKLI